ncbi:hypothetical protein U9M48_026122, partial [Paspalum notatum var. saurae]
FNQQRQLAVEVLVPQSQNEGDMQGDAGTGTGTGSAAGSSAAPDEASIIAKAIAKLDPDEQEQAKDPKRKARSNDPGWKYGFWPDVGKKDSVKCIFCKKVISAGIGRFKQHLAGGYVDAGKCGDAPALVRAEMRAYIQKRSKAVLPTEESKPAEDEEEEPAEDEPEPQPSSGTKKTSIGAKSKEGKRTQASIKVVAERHKSKKSQATLEYSTKTKEAKQIVDDHVADFFYENAIPFNVINSRSWEIMVESIGQFGPGYRSASYHDLRNPLLDRAVDRAQKLRKKHEDAWKEYGCTIMSDAWTDTRHRHLINFLANSPAGTFFLGSVNASREIANANMLADLLGKHIDLVGKEHVVQLVTDNGSNYKAAGRILMERIPTLFWTPCAAHCLDLMLEDIAKIPEFSSCINLAKKVSRFIYKHLRVLDLMREKIGGDLVRAAVTRFATSFLTLASMHRHRQGLRSLFVSDEWHQNSLSKSPEGQLAENTVLSMAFWTRVENCIRASQPLLVALRIADGDETPAAPEIMAAMDVAKSTIKESLKGKPQLLNQVLSCYDKRWDTQMEQKLYGAALFLNPAKFFAIREDDKRRASRLRSMFNDVLWKMVIDEEEQKEISKQADDYERSEVLWWGAYGGLAYELQSLAKRIVSLCCSASGCERNWSAFSHVHTKKRNWLEHKRLNRLVYVSYNTKMANRFQKIRELGSKGKKSNPLLLEEFRWDNEWVDINAEQVHDRMGMMKRRRLLISEEAEDEGDQGDIADKPPQEHVGGSETDAAGSAEMEEDEDSGGAGGPETSSRDGGFQVDEDLLD